METLKNIKNICPTTTLELVQNGAILIDVREPEEVAELAYGLAHVMHIPLSVFEARYMEIPKDKDIVMACKSGGRSMRAAGFLANHGYTRISNLQSGIVGWVEKGFPVKGKMPSTGADNSCCSTSGCC